MVIKDYYYHDYIQSNGKDFSCYKGIQRHLFMEISCSGKACVHRWFETFPMSGPERLSTLRPHEIFLKM